jgi:hypothetical protein
MTQSSPSPKSLGEFRARDFPERILTVFVIKQFHHKRTISYLLYTQATLQQMTADPSDTVHRVSP